MEKSKDIKETDKKENSKPVVEKKSSSLTQKPKTTKTGKDATIAPKEDKIKTKGEAPAAVAKDAEAKPAEKSAKNKKSNSKEKLKSGKMKKTTPEFAKDKKKPLGTDAKAKENVDKKEDKEKKECDKDKTPAETQPAKETTPKKPVAVDPVDKTKKIEKNKIALDNIVTMIKGIQPDCITPEIKKDLVDIHSLVRNIKHRMEKKTKKTSPQKKELAIKNPTVMKEAKVTTTPETKEFEKDAKAKTKPTEVEATETPEKEKEPQIESFKEDSKKPDASNLPQKTYNEAKENKNFQSKEQLQKDVQQATKSGTVLKTEQAKGKY